MIFTGKTADGSDMRIAKGVYVDPKNTNRWSSEPYTREQKAYDKVYDHCAKYQKTFRELYEQFKAGITENLPKWVRVWLITEFEKEETI